MSAQLIIKTLVFETEAEAQAAGKIPAGTFVFVNTLANGEYVIGDGENSYDKLKLSLHTAPINAWTAWKNAAAYSDCILVQIPADSDPKPIGRSDYIKLAQGGTIDTLNITTDLINRDGTECETNLITYNKDAIDSLLADMIPSSAPANSYLTTDSSGTKQWELKSSILGQGSKGDVLTTTASGVAWKKPDDGLPKGGTLGDILVTTDSGVEWKSLIPAPSTMYENYIISINSEGNYYLKESNAFGSGKSNGEVLTWRNNSAIWEAPSTDYITKSAGGESLGIIKYGDLKQSDENNILGSACFRNIRVGTVDIGDVAGNLKTGEIYFQYEAEDSSTSSTSTT